MKKNKHHMQKKTSEAAEMERERIERMNDKLKLIQNLYDTRSNARKK